MTPRSSTPLLDQSTTRRCFNSELSHSHTSSNCSIGMDSSHSFDQRSDSQAAHVADPRTVKPQDSRTESQFSSDSENCGAEGSTSVTPVSRQVQRRNSLQEAANVFTGRNCDSEVIRVELPDCKGLEMLELGLSRSLFQRTDTFHSVQLTVFDPASSETRCITYKLPLKTCKLTTLRKALKAKYITDHTLWVLVAIKYVDCSTIVLLSRSRSESDAEFETILVNLPQCNELELLKLALSQASPEHRLSKMCIFFPKSKENRETSYMLPSLCQRTLVDALIVKHENDEEEYAELDVKYCDSVV